MAIGDIPNQNLFGTNYNPEDEEEKKARLAAQGAMMGAGNIPASAFGQAPAVAPFSMEAAGQVNPMMEPQSLAVTPQAPATFLPYADDVAPPSASALSVFTPGGEVKPNIDVNAITPSPGMTSKAAPKNALLEMLERADEREAQGLPRQDAPGIIDAPVENLSGGAQEQGMDISQQAIASSQGQVATAPPPAQTLSQFMRYEDAPEQRTEQFVDEQGRMRFRPTQEALQLQAQGAVAQPPVDSAVPPAVAQPPVDALSSFEQDSLSRQQRIGGTGSFEGDSKAREARLRENERQPGESQADRDTRVAQSRTTGGQTEGLSFDDARRRAEGQLAARGVKNPTPSQVNALARGIQAGEPERLAELETKRAKDAAELRDAEAKKDFKPQIVEIGDQKLIQLSPNYYQPVRPEPTAEEPFEPRVLEEGGFTYYETAPNRFERQPSTKTGGTTGAVSSIIDETIAAGGGVATPAPTVDTPGVAAGNEFTPKQEADIQAVMGTNPTRSRAEVIEAMQTQGAL